MPDFEWESIGLDSELRCRECDEYLWDCTCNDEDDEDNE